MYFSNAQGKPWLIRSMRPEQTNVKEINASKSKLVSNVEMQSTEMLNNFGNDWNKDGETSKQQKHEYVELGDEGNK